MTRTSDSGIPSAWATPLRAANGVCVEDQTVTRSPVPLGDDRARLDRHPVRAVGHVAALDDHVGARHRGVRVPLTIVECPSRLPSQTEVLVGLVGAPVRVDERRVLGERPLRDRSTGGSGSYSTSIRPTACSASSGVIAATAATIRASKRTSSLANRRRSLTSWP